MIINISLMPTSVETVLLSLLRKADGVFYGLGAAWNVAKEDF
jgi:hypothetical protein